MTSSVSTPAERRAFWAQIMDDPAVPARERRKAAKLLRLAIQAELYRPPAETPSRPESQP